MIKVILNGANPDALAAKLGGSVLMVQSSNGVEVSATIVGITAEDVKAAGFEVA